MRIEKSDAIFTSLILLSMYGDEREKRDAVKKREEKREMASQGVARERVLYLPRRKNWIDEGRMISSEERMWKPIFGVPKLIDLKRSEIRKKTAMRTAIKVVK